jgi:hypothetical protein
MLMVEAQLAKFFWSFEQPTLPVSYFMDWSGGIDQLIDGFRGKLFGSRRASRRTLCWLAVRQSDVPAYGFGSSESWTVANKPRIQGGQFSSCIRTPISVPLPVGGGPLRFLVITVLRFTETVLSQK